jgi:hypothetical protein
LRVHREEAVVSSNDANSARVGPEEVGTGRFVWRCASALVVVLANVALVTYLVAGRGSSVPMQSAFAAQGLSSVPTTPMQHGSNVQSQESATGSQEPDPSSTVPIPRRPVPSSTTAPVEPIPATTVPPRAVVPSTSLPTPPFVAPPSLIPNLEPAAADPDPAGNILPVPDFSRACGPAGYNDSFGCILNVVAAIDNARDDEGLPSMVLPTNWYSLDPEQQLFVATNLERTARGLAPLIAVATALGPAAALGVATSVDPTAPPGFPHTEVLSNWAGNVGNPLEAMYYWMYDDGLGSPNIDCSLSSPSGCWGHRHNLLAPLACNQCVMGGAFGTTVQGATGVTELIVETPGPIDVDFTWAMEQPYLP